MYSITIKITNNNFRNINTHSNHQLETRLNYIVLVNRLVQLGVVFIRSSSPNEDTFISSQWFQELEYALFDPFLQYFYPEIHYVVKEFLVVIYFKFKSNVSLLNYLILDKFKREKRSVCYNIRM